MNSMILEKLGKFGKKIACLFEKSGLNKIISKIHGGFSSLWSKSIIVSRFKGENEAEENVLSRIMYLPVRFIEFLNKKMGRWLSEKIEESVFLDLVRTFMNNVLALNGKFFCRFLYSYFLVLCMTGFGLKTDKWILVIAFFVFWCIGKRNITDFFDSSKLVDFCKKLCGLKFKFSDIYKSEYLGTKKADILASVFGVALGVFATVFEVKTGRDISHLIVIVLAICGVTGLSLVMSYPVVGVFVALASAPFVPTMILAGICALTTASFLVKAVCDADFKWRKEGIGIGFFLFVLFLSSLFSFSPVKSLMVWGMYLIFAGFYFVIVNTLRIKEQIYGILRTFVLLGALVAIYGILQYIFGWNTTNAWIDEEMFEEATMRVYSTMENPNVLGEYLLLLIPLSAIFIFKKGGTAWEKITYSGIFLMGALCMIFTQSRGCWLGLILAAAIFVTFYNGKLWALAPLALLALPFVIPETMIDRMLSVGNLEDSSTSYRVFIWKGTFRMLRDFWIGGIGMGEGAFRSVYPIYSYIGIIAPHAHNTFLQLLVEGGIGTLFIFLGMMISFLKKVANIFANSVKNSIDGVTALAIGSGVAGFLLQSMFDYTFYNYRMMAMFFMILAVGVSLKACKGEEK